jgi:hypothetical protein
MNSKIKTAVFGGLLAGSLLASAVPALARDQYWDRSPRYGWKDRGYNRGWDRRGDYRSNSYSELEQARQQLNYDASHHKSRKKLAQDQQRIEQLQNDMWRYRRGF